MCKDVETFNHASLLACSASSPGLCKGVTNGVAKGVFITGALWCFNSTCTLCRGDRISLNRRGNREKAGSFRRLACFLGKVLEVQMTVWEDEEERKVSALLGVFHNSH